MSFYLFKVLFTGCLVVIITEIAKINVKIGAIITALPLTTLLVIFWLYFEKVPSQDISDYVKNTLYFLIATIPLFIIFPILVSKNGFFVAVFFSILAVIIAAFIINIFLKHLIS